MPKSAANVERVQTTAKGALGREVIRVNRMLGDLAAQRRTPTSVHDTAEGRSMGDIDLRVERYLLVNKRGMCR